MATTLFIIFVLAIMHFAYENIIAPTLRIYQRNKLFVLRDKLRNIHFNALNKQDKQAFKYIENSLTNCIQNLPYVNISNFSRYKQEYKENEELRKSVDEKINKIENCSVTELKDIFNDSGEIIYHAIWINSGILFLYFIPIAIVVILLEYGINFVKKYGVSFMKRYGVNFAKNMIVSPTSISLKNYDNLVC